MSFGKMNGFADIVITKRIKDSEGFSTTADEILASVRVYREGRHGSERRSEERRVGKECM